MKRVILLLVIIAGLFVGIGFTTSAAPVQITTSSVDMSTNNSKKVVQDALGNYYVTYTMTYSSYPHIFVRKSTDGGNTWLYWNGTAFSTTGTETPIESYSYSQYNPTLAVDSSNNLHVVWTGRPTSAGYDDVRYTKYTVANGTWSAPINLSNTTNYNQYASSIVIDSSDNIHVAWYGRNAGAYFQIRYSKYSSGSWSAPIFLTNESYNQMNPTMGIDGNNKIYIVWYGQSSTSTTYQQIRYIVYNGTWSTPADITSAGANQILPSLAIDNSNNVHVAWDNGNITYSKYNGTIWSTPVSLGAGGYGPSIDTDSSNNVHVIWRNGGILYYARYTNTWTRGYSFTSTVNQMYPSIIKGASVFVWQGTATGSVPSISGTSLSGAMFAPVSMLQTLVEREVSIPVSTDIADNGNGSDIRVTFTGAIDESNITGYRILVVPSTAVGAFTVATAGSSGNYVAEPKNGNLGPHTVVLSSLINDSSGYAITNMVPYQVFVLALGQNSYANILSNGSNYLTLTAPTSPATVNKITSVAVDLSYPNAKKIVKDSSGNYFVAYLAMYNGYNNVFVRKSDDGGTTWKYYNGTGYGVTGPEVPLYPAATLSTQYGVSMAIDSMDNIYAAWTGKFNGAGYDEVKYSKYNPLTGTWSTAANITSSSTYNQYSPSMAVDSNDNIHLVWHGRTGSYFQIKYSKYSSGSWSAPLDLTSGSYNQNIPSIALDGSDNIYVVWYGTSATSPTYNQIRFAMYNGSWAAAADITSAGANQTYPSIAVDSSNIPHIVWDNGNIQYSKYTGTWSAPVSLGAGGYGPTIDIDGSNGIHVIWRNGAVLKHATYNGSWGAAVSMTATVNQQYPSLIRGANALVWQGTVTGSAIPFTGTSMNGMMFYAMTPSSQVPIPGTPTASDVGDNHDARDIRVVFTGANDEANISGYRIFVVPSGQAGSFSVSAASALSSTAYVAEAKNGNNGSHNLTLTQTLTDTTGASIAEGVSYKIFILARGQNGYNSSLSVGSNTFIISSVVPKATGVSASDIANNGDGRDIQVTFTGANDEANIGSYRIFIVPTGQAGSFDESTASSLVLARYVVEPANGANVAHVAILTQTLKDSTGAAITNGVSYTAFVLAIGQNGYLNSLSTGAVPVTLASVLSQTIVAAPIIADASNYGNAKDIKVTFTAPSNETKIKEYRIFIVPSGTTLDEPTASAIKDTTKYNLEKKSRIRSIKKHIVTLKYNLKDVAGNSINTSTDYYAYVLVVGIAPNPNDLSPISAQSVRLDNNSGAVSIVTGLSVTDNGGNNNASDLLIKFNKAANETPIKEYKIFIVPQAQGALNLANAITKANTTTNYIKVAAANRALTKTYTVKPTSSQVDSTGAAVTGGTYNVYVLSVPKNVNARYYSIAGPVSVTIQ